MKAQCRTAVEQAIGRPLKDSEVKQIEDRIVRGARELKGMNRQQLLSMTPAQRMEHVAITAARGYLADVAIAERRKIISAQRLAEIKAVIDADPANGLERLRDMITFGAQRGVGRSSIEGDSRAVATWARGQMFDTLATASPKFFGMINNVEGQKLILRELMGEPTGNADAARAARAFQETAEALRQRFNRGGGNVGRLEDWGLPHHHSQPRVAAAGKPSWVGFILPRLNREKYIREDGTLMDDGEVVSMLGRIYETIASDGAVKDMPSGGRGGSVVRHGEASRSVHFKDADSLSEYWGKFGERSMMEVMLSHIDAVSRDIATLEKFGPSSDYNFRQLLDHAQRVADEHAGLVEGKATGKRSGLAKQVEVEWSYATGKSTGIANRALYNLFAGIRSLNVATDLGSAAITSITDHGPMALTSVFNKLPAVTAAEWEARLMADAGKREFARRQGLMLQTMIGDLNRYGSFGEVAAAGSARPGAGIGQRAGAAAELASEKWARGARNLANTVMKLSLLPQLTDVRRAAFSISMMDALGTWSRQSFANLDAELQRHLRGVGITPEVFDIWSGATVADLGAGHTILTADAIANVPDAHIAHVLGGTPTPGEIARARDNALTQLNRLVQDESFMAVLEPGIRTRAAMFGMSDPSSVKGLVLRSGLQHLSFGFAYTLQHLGRVSSLMAQEGKWSAARYGAALITATTVLGGMALLMGDVASGRDPRPVNSPDFALRAFAKGGGLGIYGDILLYGQTASTKTAAEVLLGPTFGKVAKPLMIASQDLEAQLAGKPSDKGAQYIRWAKSLTPGQTLWWTKAATDHLVWNDMMESASPGYLYRQEKRIQRMTGNEAYWEAREPLPGRAPDVTAVIK